MVLITCKLSIQCTGVLYLPSKLLCLNLLLLFFLIVLKTHSMHIEVIHIEIIGPEVEVLKHARQRHGLSLANNHLLFCRVLYLLLDETKEMLLVHA